MPYLREGQKILKKGKGAIPHKGHRLVQTSSTLAIEPVGGKTTESVTHGQCNARPTVTFPARERHRHLTGTKLYCLVNRGTRVRTTCPRLIRGPSVTSPAHYHYTDKPQKNP